MTTDQMTKPFPITSVCREDLERYFTKYEIEALNDGDMEYIASRMGDAYCNNGYWDDLQDITQVFLNEKKVLPF